MTWLLLAAGALIACLGVVYLVGAMLPRDHHATRQGHFRAKPEVIYAVLAGPPDWRPDVKAYGDLPERNGRRQWWEQDAHRQKVTFELVEDHPPSRRVVRIADQGLPFGGRWTFEIATASDGGADLRIHEDGEIYNVMFRFLARFFFGYHSSIEGFLRDWGAKFGEPVRIEA
jgi:hypothetical protein